MNSLTLLYHDGSDWQSKVYSKVRYIKGLDTFDGVELRLIQYEELSGDIREDIPDFRRDIEFCLGFSLSEAEREFLLLWMLNSPRVVTSASSTAFISLDPRYSTIWEGDSEEGRRYIIRGTESRGHSTFPGIAESEDELAWIKLKVQITGTQASPQSLTTGTAPLATMETGAAWPTFDASSYVYTVLLNSAPYQEAHINVVTQISEVAGNLTWSLAVQDLGKAAADGNYYTDIIIIAQAKP